MVNVSDCEFSSSYKINDTNWLYLFLPNLEQSDEDREIQKRILIRQQLIASEYIFEQRSWYIS